MSNKNNQPFSISRSNSSRSNLSFLDKSLSNSFEEPNLQSLRKPVSFLSKQSSLLVPQTANKTCYNIFKTDLNLMPELLEKYSQANLYYRDEEFTQQSENFIEKIAIDKRIPKEFKAKFPLYQIMVSVCKVFMLNEYEIVAFACTLDHCNWKIDEVIYPEEHLFLEEFPANFGVEIDDNCKRFIMYLMIISFSLKQYLNEKSEIDPVQAYCEKIFANFQPIFNRWTRLSSLQKFTYSALEINRKFKFLSKRDVNEHNVAPKDYNMLVETIMSLTGSYNSKSKPSDPSPLQTQYQNLLNSRTQLFQNLFPQQSFESKVLYSEGPLSINVEKGLSHQMSLESTDEQGVKPSNSFNYSRQGSFSQFLTNFTGLKRHDSFELNDKGGKKKVKWEFPRGNSKESEDLDKENTTLLQNQSGGTGSQNEGDEYLNLNVPTLSKKASGFSQTQEDILSFTKFNSNLSFLYENKP